MLFLPQPSTLLPLLLTSPPASYFHLLSQGPCGTLRGWWGWGGWWCRWWWNSHSVSSLPVLELEASPYLSLSFPTYSSLISKRKGWGWGVRQVRKASCFFATVSSTHLYAAHPTIKPHMPPVFVFVLQPVCFLCHHYCLVWSLIATNSNPNPKNSPGGCYNTERFFYFFFYFFFSQLYFHFSSINTQEQRIPLAMGRNTTVLNRHCSYM